MVSSVIKKIIKFNKINDCWHLSGLVLSMTFWVNFYLFSPFSFYFRFSFKVERS